MLALKGRIVTQEVLAAREQLEAARRDAVTAARATFWKLWVLHQGLSITERTIGLLRELEQVSTTRYEAGRTSFQDVIKVRVQRELLDERLITLQEQLQTTHMVLREILHLPPDTPIGVPQMRLAETGIPDSTALYDTALASRQELKVLHARINKIDAMLELAETMLLPAFDMGLSLYRDQAIRQVGTQAGQTTFATRTTASTGAGLPKRPWSGLGDAHLREMRQKRQAMQEELNQMQDATLAMVRKRWFALDRARREKRLYQDTVVAAIGGGPRCLDQRVRIGQGGVCRRHRVLYPLARHESGSGRETQQLWDGSGRTRASGRPVFHAAPGRVGRGLSPAPSHFGG